MAKKINCDMHSEMYHAIFGNGSNKGLLQRMADLERAYAIGLGVMVTVNFIWLFFAYPLLRKHLNI